MKRNLLLVLFVLIFVSGASAQVTPTTTPAKEANPADVSTIDGIMKAVYDVISGDAGQKRDWDRFRSLFYRDARLIPSGKSQKTGNIGARAYTAEQYITGSEPLMEKEGFFEKEIGRRTEIYGTMATIFSTYASFHKAGDKEPFERGINSFQLLYDGKRWWVVTIYWLGETKETPIPKKYLKTKK